MKRESIEKIIFIVADTLRTQSLGLYGASPSSTPHIDKLGQKGIVFTNAYATITKTDPSITSIMTGMYPLSQGLVNHGKNVSREEEKNLNNKNFLAEILKKEGFKTAAVDWLYRWHKRGFGYYSGKLAKDFGSYDLARDNLPAFFYLRLLDKGLIKMFRRDFILRFYYTFFPHPVLPYDPANKVVDKAINLLKRMKKQKLFLYLHFWDAHIPHTRLKGIKSYLFDDIEKGYNAEVSFFDQELGRLFHYLQSTRQLEKTLIVLTSDHGENFYKGGRPLNHEGLYEETVKIPLIITHSLLPSKQVDSLVQHIDIMPTILDMLNIKNSEAVDGKSLLPLMYRTRKKIRDFAYFEDIIFRRLRLKKTTTRRRGIRVGRFKYIQTIIGKTEKIYSIMPSEQNPIVQEELYDLKKDPFEKENFIDKNPKTASLLRSKLHSLSFELNKKRSQSHPLFHKKLEKSLQIIKKAKQQFKNGAIALAWTGGKDSTVLLHLVRLAFGEKTPFKVIFNDSTMEFDEIYRFIDEVAKLWGIKLITIRHSDKELKEFYQISDPQKKKELSRIMKITAINTALEKYKLKAFMAAIRWDEHESRSKEKYFSPRSNHMRIHPILHFTEKDIWEYIKHFGVPYVSLYDKGYRSLGEKPFTKPVPPGGSERSGREREKEQLMERLRNMGYW